MSFYSWSGISQDKVFIGLDNFRTLINDPIVWKAMGNNIFFLSVTPVLTMGLSLLFAFLLTRKSFFERSFYRTVFFYPNVLAIVVISILWSFIYNPTFGILNSFLEMIGLDHLTRAWLGESGTVLWALALPMVWQAVGYYMVIYIAAMEGVPSHLYEAAVLEGASPTQQFTQITFPLIWSVVRITIVFFLIGVFNGSFVFVQIMTNSGPDHASEVLMTYMYKQAMQNGNFGYGAAIGVLSLVIAFILAALSERLTERDSIEF